MRALAVMSTLMPHLAGGRHHIYRGVIALALLELDPIGWTGRGGS